MFAGVQQSTLMRLWNEVLGLKIAEAFPRMTYQDAMASYGSDKPDLRYKEKVYYLVEGVS
jgi:aspartyl-tRNA synthetase